jgi:hypothetical protein
MRERMPTREELIAGRANQMNVAEQLFGHLVVRIHPDARHARQREALPGSHADLEVRAWLELLMNPGQELVSLHGGRSPFTILQTGAS